ncbi:hypothetical protein SMALA_4801 [Streptomyces malaysiensis subsp. malaysiensis]|nr:hypothetical protein SMALA_4801 [Streptomyces malaysiensis]
MARGLQTSVSPFPLLQLPDQGQGHTGCARQLTLCHATPLAYFLKPLANVGAHGSSVRRRPRLRGGFGSVRAGDGGLVDDPQVGVGGGRGADPGGHVPVRAGGPCRGGGALRRGGRGRRRGRVSDRRLRSECCMGKAASYPTNRARVDRRTIRGTCPWKRPRQPWIGGCP